MIRGSGEGKGSTRLRTQVLASDAVSREGEDTKKGPRSQMPRRRRNVWAICAVLVLVALVVMVAQTLSGSTSGVVVNSAQKREFLKSRGHEYGYNGKIYDLRAKEFPNLRGTYYLDYTGSGVYQQGQLVDTFKDLSEHLYSNTHSRSPSSALTEAEVQSVRELVLSWFHTNAREYSIIFTSGATGALKLVGELFPWSEHSEFIYLQDNHNSVLGIREYALEHGASFLCTDLSQVQDELKSIKENQHDDPKRNETYNLFAFPAESNFAGEVFPLELIDQFHDRALRERRGEWKVLLDAAAFVAHRDLDLSKYPADFVAVSFYKMFGFPSGLGALLVRNEAAHVLRKTYFGGGTVVVATTKKAFHQLQARISSRFEDGTIPFLNIVALKYGFERLQRLGLDHISLHTWSLTRYLYESLRDLKHDNGRPVCEIYGNHEANNIERQGPIINFNLRDPGGNYVGYYYFQTLSTELNFHVRTGCLCNPGACYDSVRLSDSCVIESANARESCGDEMDMIDGRPAGAIRASIGYPTTFEDVDAFVRFVRDNFVNSRKGVISSAPPSPF